MADETTLDDVEESGLAVLRLDVGRRFSDRKFQGYSLDRSQRDAGFVHFFFGYNY